MFFKSSDTKALREWYGKALGLEVGEYGKPFTWREDDRPEERGYTVFSPFKAETTYFEPSAAPFMINFRVEDLDGLLAQVRAGGGTVVGGPNEEENGRFAWILDPEGNKIELWEPVPSAEDPYL